MANQTDGKHIALFGRKALAAVMAVISCLYLSAGFMPSEYALADEVPPVTAEEPAGEDKKEEPESKPEPETKN